jgi:hypothetical protein
MMSHGCAEQLINYQVVNLKDNAPKRLKISGAFD